PVHPPEFLVHHAPTRSRRRITPVSRVPATGRLGEVWHVAARRAPEQLITVDRPCDIDPHGPTERTYAGWAGLVDDAAGWLVQAGVRPWDRVAVLKDNHFDVALLACAAARIGAVPALLSGTYGPDVARTLLTRLERPFVVTDSAHAASCGLTAEAVERLTTRTICVDAPDDRPDLVGLDALRGARRPGPRLRDPCEPMIITHTSGTTGVPKLVMHSGDSVRALSLIETERWPLFGLRRTDTMAFADPFWHERITTGMIAWATINQRMLMLSDPLSPDVARLLAEHRPTVVETLPNAYLVWERLAADPARPFADVRVFINSFDAIHTRTIRTLLAASERRRPYWLQAWSQSENGLIVMRPYTRRSVRRRGHRPPPTQILGWPIPGLIRVRAVDPETGRRVKPGRPGLIELKAPGRCLAYVGEQHRHDRKRNGPWWNTGDLAVINRFGAIRLLDREIDRIPRASAIEIEDVLLDRLPETTEVVVLPALGSLPVPVLSTVDGQPIDPRAWSRATADLPALAEPLHIQWEQFPRTGTWKINRVRLREWLLPGVRAVGTGHWT
ncbi:class I adenylate-forming enzyme family protein, partial [Actinomadura rubrisoli]